MSIPKTADDLFGAFGKDVEYPDMIGAYDSKKSLLTTLCSETSLSIVVEEAVHASTVDENVLRVDDAKRP